MAKWLSTRAFVGVMVEFVSIAAWVNAQKGKQDKLTRKIVLDVDKGVSRRSPVDTGRFKGNWMMGVDFKPAGYDWELKDKKPLGAVGDTVTIHDSMIPKVSAGHVYWLVNNLPYANALEWGHSKQTNNHPAGIVGLTLVQFDGIVERAMQSVK